MEKIIEEKVIKLSEPNTLVLLIEDEKGNKTGDSLTFNLTDIELPLKLQKLYEEDRKITDWFNKEIVIINKRQDRQEKGHLFSKNKEDEINAANKYIKEEARIFDEFLGKDGVKKLLHGRPLGWDTLHEIDLIVKNQITPYLNQNVLDFKKIIKEKYGVETNDVLE